MNLLPSPVLLAVGLLVAALSARGAEAPADLVVLNANVVTVDAASTRAAAVAIRGGVFVAVGSNDDVRKLVGPNTRTIDAQGHMVVPGLIESHVHSTGVARSEANQPFRQLYSIAEIQDWVRTKAKEVGPGQWIQIPRVDVTRIKERRIPTRADLDAAAPNNPTVFLWQYANRTVQILNTAALNVVKLTKDTEVPAAGKIHFDDQGQPTGRIDNSSGLVTKFMPARGVPDDKYQDSLVKLLHRYNEIGITSIGERNSNVDGYRTYQALKTQGRLPVRVTVTIGLASNGSVEDTERVIKAIPFKTGDGDDWVKAGPLKIGVDGGTLYGTAFMREAYPKASHDIYFITDPSYRGDLRISAEKIKNMIRTGHRLGWQMSSHVTGDAGVDAVLDAVEAANADSPIGPRRYNLIHGYFTNPETAKRVAALGVVPDTQPDWYYKDGDALADVLGAKKVATFIGLQTWLKAGAKVVLNSDHMFGFDPETSLNPYNPFLAIQTAVTRKTQGGKIFGPEQRISREEALRMVTINAAWMNFDEKKTGSIEVGKLADLAILTDDLLKCAEEKIHEIRARVTIVGGKVVYERAGK